jgi:hypothetical protein
MAKCILLIFAYRRKGRKWRLHKSSQVAKICLVTWPYQSLKFSTRVRNVSEYRKASKGGMLCSHIVRASPSSM